MNDLALLVLVLCVFYLHDCSLWIEQDTVVFLARRARRWRPVSPHPLLRGRRKGLLLSFRLPPLAPVYIAYPWRIMLSPTHMASAGRAEPPAEAAEASVTPAIPWSALHRVVALDGLLRVNDEHVIACQTQERAQATAELLRALVQRSQADRAAAIADAVRRSLDLVRLREDLARLRSAGWLLRVLCNSMFVFLFLLIPALMAVISLARLWPMLVALLVALLLAIAFAYREAHRTLWPTDRGERRGVLIHLFLYPPAAIRAYDALAHRLCAPYHPVAVAVALCDAPVRDRFLRHVLRDLRFTAKRTAETVVAEDTEAWFRATLETHMHRMLKEQGLRIAAYLDAPLRTDRNSRSYCPRCETEYAILDGDCKDCKGVPLVMFAPTGAAEVA